MGENNHPPEIMAIDGDSTFAFACHPELGCFTQCCRMLELALTPYDVLRLRKGTGLNSAQLLERYVIIEQDPGEAFPRLYLTMVDDGHGSCPFVSDNGCAIYDHRPGACRTYPLGRGTSLGANETLHERFVLIREKFCQGFSQQSCQNPKKYLEDQEAISYNRSNDKVAAILQHEAVHSGLIPSQKDVDLFLLLLYDLDTLRHKLEQGLLAECDDHVTEMDLQRWSDEELLDYAVGLLPKLIFPQMRPPAADELR